MLRIFVVSAWSWQGHALRDFRVRQPERGLGRCERRGPGAVIRKWRRDQEMLCTAAATGLSPPTSSSVWCRVPG